jgi:perosamine synthetase
LANSPRPKDNRLQLQSVETAAYIPLVEPWLTAPAADAVRDQVLSGFVGPGKTCNDFSTELAAFLGAERCLLTTSGTIALSVAAKALGLDPGDEILIPAYGVISTINAFASIGLKPRLVDIDRATCCISPERLLQAISPTTRAVCLVNFSGYTGPLVREVRRICDEKHLLMIEDAACALGHRYEGVSAGCTGDVGTYSFSVPKVLTTGQGGAVVARDRAVFDKAGAFVDHGDLEWRKTGINRDIGTNLRFNDVLAALGLSQLREIEPRLARRRAYYETLRARLDGRLYEVPGPEAPLHSIVFTADPEKLVSALNQRGIGAIVSPYRTNSRHPAYAGLGVTAYPNADYWTDNTAYLPFGTALTPLEANRIADAIEAIGVEILPPPK